jgi:hypothetical protein
MGISSCRYRNGEGAPEGKRRLVQMGRVANPDERPTRRLFCAPFLEGAGTLRIVVGSPNPRAIGANWAASKGTVARLAVAQPLS